MASRHIVHRGPVDEAVIPCGAAILRGDELAPDLDPGADVHEGEDAGGVFRMGRDAAPGWTVATRDQPTGGVHHPAVKSELVGLVKGGPVSEIVARVRRPGQFGDLVLNRVGADRGVLALDTERGTEA